MVPKNLKSLRNFIVSYKAKVLEYFGGKKNENDKIVGGWIGINGKAACGSYQ